LKQCEIFSFLEYPIMIPLDNFTPHGYLDNPYHSWKLNPSGVLRSGEPLGMGWHVPNVGSYGRNQFHYTAHLSLGLRVGTQVMITPEDFQRHGCVITCHVHTKNRFEYTCYVPQYQLKLTARYVLIQERALGCVLSLSTTASHQLSVTCYLLHRHTHNPHTSRLWEHGLYACQGPGEDSVMLGIASEGDVFVHGTRSADGFPLTFDGMGYVVSLDEASAWAQGREVAPPSITQSQQDTGWQVRTVILPCRVTLGGEAGSVERIINVVLARGVSRDQSYRHWEDGMEEIARAEAELRADDEYFWSRAPQLAGDWPESWRRGLVYDFETLRMVMRPSVGLIPHVFDGMQLQAPREVLAEAAMDTLFLSYAHPELAAEVILGHFESAPLANVPCLREDGSYNMVADDGQICGTAPEWGFPLWCCDHMVRRTGDLLWLRRLYPKAAAYLRWWLEQRRDAEGWLVYACSWESGQDVSSRFGPQQTGGTIIQHVRPVDLQASMAQGAEILARWASLLGQEQPTLTAIETPIDFAAEATWWQQIANEFSVKTRLMWQHGWFRDYDAVTSEWSSQQDAMHLAPVFCGVAAWGQVEQLRPFLTQPPMHSSGWAPLSWPPVVMTLVGAADVAQMPLEAAELAYGFIDASYRSTDRRELDEQGGLPGVTREYHATAPRGKWGDFDYVNAGIEGYGWGALSIHLLMRYILGLHEEEVDRLTVRPVLPQALRRLGATYQAEPIPWGRYTLRITCTVKDAQRYRLRLRCAFQATEAKLEGARQSVMQQETQEYQCEWEGRWGEERTLQLPDLTIFSV
jgi:Trehalase